MAIHAIIAGGVSVLRRRAGTVAVWAAIYAVVTAAFLSVASPMFAAMLHTQREAMMRSAAGGAPPGLPDGMLGALLAMELGGALLAIMAFAAVVRATIATGPDRFAFLRVGMDELRLLGLGLLAIAAAFGAEVAVVLLLALVGALLHVLVGNAAMVAVLVILGVGAVGALIYVEVRLSLAPVLTVIERRVVIGAAWRATRGRFWTLFVAYLLIALVYALIGTILVAVTNPGLLTAYATMDPATVNAAAAAQIARQSAGLSPMLSVQLVLGAAIMVATGVVLVAAMTTAAQAFADPIDGRRATVD